jgi:molybdate transport system ATP-binding protein
MLGEIQTIYTQEIRLEEIDGDGVKTVSLALQPLQGTSILNSFPVVVSELVDDGPSQVMVRLAAGDAVLLARVTRRSQRLLAIETGKRLHAQIKSVALLA